MNARWQDVKDRKAQIDYANGRTPRCTCCSHVVDRPRVDAVVGWSHHIGNYSYLCQSCLNNWLDNADDDPELEPAAIAWLDDSYPVLADFDRMFA